MCFMGMPVLNLKAVAKEGSLADFFDSGLDAKNIKNNRHDCIGDHDQDNGCDHG